MTLEEKLRAYAAKGELVHLSLVATAAEFRCTYAAASTLGGYSVGVSADPVEAIEKAFKTAPIKTPRVSKPREFTAAVKDGGLPNDWTAP